MKAKIDTNPTEIENYSAYALILYKAGRLSTTDSLLVNTFLGEYIYKDRRFEEAVPLLSIVIDQYKTLPHSENEGVTIGAITLSYAQYKQLLHSNIVALGNCQIELEDYESAIKTLESSFAILDDNAPAWGYYGIALGYSGDVNGAARAFLNALTHDPEVEAFWKNLMSCYETLGIRSLIEMTLKDFKYTSLAGLKNTLYTELLSIGEYEKARMILNQLLEQDKKDYLLNVALGSLEFSLGNYEASIKAYKRAVKGRKQTYGHYLLAKAQSAVGKSKDAKNNAKKAVKLWDENNLAWNLVKLFEAKKDTMIQNISVLWIREANSKDDNHQISLEATYLVGLTVPLGFVVRDLIEILALGKDHPIMNQNPGKAVEFTIAVTRDQQIIMNPLRSLIGTKKFKEPLLKSFEVYSLKRSENIEFRKMRHKTDDLLLDGNRIVLCNTYTPTSVKLVIAALEESIIDLAEPILQKM